MSDNMNLDHYANLQQEQYRAEQNRTGSALGTGVDIAAEGMSEAGIFARRQTVPPADKVFSDAPGYYIAESSSEISSAAAEAGGALLDCAAEAGGSIIGGVVGFICECIAGICDGL